jgi:ferrous iron transport protein B
MMGAIASKSIRIALAGNPNSGKTTVFNNLTGARQHVGNYPGVTVEKKLGYCTRRDRAFEVVDLPGSYSLTAYSPEEVIARQFLLEERPDVVIVVIDASNLERNLYLAVQLIEMGAPVVLACNAMDLVAARGDILDAAELARQLDVPAVSTVASRRHGMDDLLSAAAQVAEVGWRNREFPFYDAAVEEAIARIEREIRNTDLSDSLYPPRWIAIKLLEKDLLVSNRWRFEAVQRAAAAEGRRLAALLGESAETVLAGQRYNFIASVCASAVTTAGVRQRSTSDRIDALVMHRVLGIPIFLAAIFAVFWTVFNVGAIPSAWIQNLTRFTASAVGSWWPVQSASPLKSLLVNGVIGGVGNVFTFLPNILILFLAIAVLEDSGYMSRVAVIMDRLMHRVGLHGKSFIPLLLGFGCTVPAIMATRTLESRRDRLTSILVAPLMSCGARLPIYSLIIPAFFPAPWQAPMLWAIYLIGIVLAMVMSRVLRSTLFDGECTPFVMELPAYRIPSARDAVIHMWERSLLYLKKAGTVILGISIVLWALTTFPQPPAGNGSADRKTRLEYSLAGRGGKLLEPLLKPMGFDWKIGTALIGAFAAKEVFVAQMGIIYAAADGPGGEAQVPLRAHLRRDYPPLVGLAIMLFCLIGTPCMTTVAVTRRETGSWRWPLLQFGGLTLLAYGITVAVFQTGRFLGWGI